MPFVEFEEATGKKQYRITFECLPEDFTELEEMIDGYVLRIIKKEVYEETE